MLSGMADKYAMGLQQTVILSLYQDQVRALGLAAWKKLEEGPTEALVSGSPRSQTRTYLLPFIDKVNKILPRKFPLGNLGTGLFEC